MATPTGRRGVAHITQRHKVIKLAVLGDKQVGKTSLVSRYVHDSFSPHYTYTQGGDLVYRYMSIDKHQVLVKIVDAAGHHYVRSLIKSLYRDVQGILVIFDVTRNATFNSVQEWLNQIELVNSSCPVIYIVGNKLDLTSHRCVPCQLAECEGHRLGVPYYETSAKTGYNVVGLFTSLLQDVWPRVTPRVGSPQSIVISEHEDKEDNSCCSIT